MTGLTLIHTETRNDYDIPSAVRVYLRAGTGELVIDERFRGAANDQLGALLTSSRTILSAEGLQRILDHIRPPPATEHHGPIDDARAETIRQGIG